MKKLLIFVLIFSSLWLNAQQNDTINEDFSQIKEDLYNFYKSLDRENPNSDFLWNYGFLILNDLEQWYAGQPIMTSLAKWIYIYNSVEQSNFIDNDFLPKDSTLLKYSELNDNTPSKIALSLLFYDGDYLPIDELQIITENNSTSANYRPMNLFAGTTLLQNNYNLTANYVFYPELLFTNQKDNIEQVFVDFGNNDGYQELFIDEQNSYNITYECNGTKNVMFKLITKQNDTLISYSKIEILALNDFEYDFKGIIPFSDTSNFVLFKDYQVKGDSTVQNFRYYANYMYIEGDDDVLDKPIIFVEGFDIAGDLTLKVLYSMINSYFSIPELKEKGFDIFILNLQAPDHALFLNAIIIKNFIKQINNDKIGNLENVLIGFSMGGVLCRIALKQLENDDYDHEVGFFASIDAPQKGANIPIGLQYDARIINQLIGNIPQISGYLTDIIEEIFGFDIPYTDLYQMLNSTSARQMLIRHNWYPFPNPEYEATQLWLENLGYPEECRIISSVSGSNEGTTIGIAPRSTLLDFNLLLGINNIIIRSWYPSTNSLQNVAYYVHTILWPIQIINYKFYPYYIDNKDLSNAPGGRLNFGEGEFNWGIISSERNLNFDFIPALSAIDIDNSIWDAGNLTFLNENLSTQNAEFILDNNLTPFNDIYADSTNYGHPSQLVYIIDAMKLQEIMFDSMYIQNRTLDKNRDFEATNKIIAGNDITDIPHEYHEKYITQGNVVVKNGSTVNFVAGESINLSQGFHVESGGKFHAYIDPNFKKTSKIHTISHSQHKILGNRFFSDTTTLFTDANDYQSIEWIVSGNNFHKTYSGSSIKLSNIKTGQYSVFCNVTYSDTTIGVSSIIKVKKYSLPVPKAEIIPTDNNITIYPNPANDNIRILVPLIDESFEITIHSITGNIVLKKQNVTNGQEINIESLNSGTYLLTIKSQNYVWHKKFIKN